MTEYQAFVGGSNVSQSYSFDMERTVNMYLEQSERPGSTGQSALYRRPGVNTLVTATAGPGKANFAQNGHNYAVIGAEFVEIGQFGAITVLGTVAQDNNPAFIVSNGDAGGQILVASGDNGYVWDLTALTFTQVRTGNTTTVGFLDGFFLAFSVSNSTFYVSDQLDGTVWDPTQFAQRSIAPDNWVTMIVFNRLIYLLGSQTSEVWWNAGTFPFPFEPHPSGFMQWGCAATFSPKAVNGSLYWLGTTLNGIGSILRANGFTPENIATKAIQYALANYPTISDAIGDALTWNGHNFYNAYLPIGNTTIVFDSDSNEFTEWGTWKVEQNQYDVWRACYHVFMFNEHRMLDLETGAVYRISDSYGVDVDDRPLRWLRRAPTVVNEMNRVYYARFEIYGDVGIGTSTGQGEDPQVMMRYSDDGGRSWSNELSRSMGKMGEYNTRVFWDRLGQGRRRVFEVSGSDPVPYRLVSAFLTLGNGQGDQ